MANLNLNEFHNLIMNSNPEQLLYQAELSFSNEDYKKTHQILKQLFKLNKSYYPSYGLMGKILYYLKKIDKSEIFFRRAVSFYPKDFESFTYHVKKSE